MRILILGSAESRYCCELAQAARARGLTCDVVSPVVLSSHLRTGSETVLASTQTKPAANPTESLPAEVLFLEQYDACIIRSMPTGSMEQVIFRMDLLWSLEQAGVRMINSPKGMECAIDKYLTLARCQHFGVPVPQTVCCQSAQEALNVFLQWEENAVVKPLFGAEGRGIIHLTDRETARRVFRALEQIGAVIYLQRYIRHGGSDLRVLMLDGEPLGAIRRSSTTDFRTNCSLTGTASPHALTVQELQLATQACRATGVQFAGIDLIYDHSGQLFLLEVNGCPGWQAFRQVTGIDVPGRLIDWLRSS